MTRSLTGHLVSHAVLPLALCAAALVFAFSLRHSATDQQAPRPPIEMSAVSLTLP